MVRMLIFTQFIVLSGIYLCRYICMSLPFFFSSQPPKSENAEYYLYMDMQRADGDIESCVVNVHHQRNSLIEGLFNSCLHIIVFHYYKIIATRNVRHATIYTS